MRLRVHRDPDHHRQLTMDGGRCRPFLFPLPLVPLQIVGGNVCQRLRTQKWDEMLHELPPLDDDVPASLLLPGSFVPYGRPQWRTTPWTP